jgi:hypothetical protein
MSGNIGLYKTYVEGNSYDGSKTERKKENGNPSIPALSVS